MTLEVTTLKRRPELAEQVDRLAGETWPTVHQDGSVDCLSEAVFFVEDHHEPIADDAANLAIVVTGAASHGSHEGGIQLG
jgi:hypothetical protein